MCDVTEARELGNFMSLYFQNEQIDILISKNQVQQILYHVYYFSVMIK